jgi:hypothetical protein
MPPATTGASSIATTGVTPATTTGTTGIPVTSGNCTQLLAQNKKLVTVPGWRAEVDVFWTPDTFNPAAFSTSPPTNAPLCMGIEDRGAQARSWVGFGVAASTSPAMVRMRAVVVDNAGGQTSVLRVYSTSNVKPRVDHGNAPQIADSQSQYSAGTLSATWSWYSPVFSTGSSSRVSMTIARRLTQSFNDGAPQHNLRGVFCIDFDIPTISVGACSPMQMTTGATSAGTTGSTTGQLQTTTANSASTSSFSTGIIVHGVGSDAGSSSSDGAGSTVVPIVAGIALGVCVVVPCVFLWLKQGRPQNRSTWDSSSSASSSADVDLKSANKDLERGEHSKSKQQRHTATESESTSSSDYSNSSTSVSSTDGSSSTGNSRSAQMSVNSQSFIGGWD